MATGRPGDESVVRMQFMLDLRRRGISDQAVLRAMDEVPREHFVESPLVGEAYFDRALPIACGQTISQPYLVAYMTEQLGVQPEHRILEVGTGSGYQAAVLSRLAREVISIERYRTLADAARSRLATLGFRNVDVRVGDGLLGVPERAPYDRIMVTAAAEAIPEQLVDRVGRQRCDASAIGSARWGATARQDHQKQGWHPAGRSDRRAFCAIASGASTRIVRNLPFIR